MDQNSLFCEIKIIDFNGTVIQNQTVEKTLKAFDISILSKYNDTEFTEEQMKRTVINMKARSTSGKVSENNFFFVPPVNRTILNPGLTHNVTDRQLTITAKHIANYVWVRSAKGNPVNLEENYFDMLPGDKKVITIPENIDEKDLQVTCYQT